MKLFSNPIFSLFLIFLVDSSPSLLASPSRFLLPFPRRMQMHPWIDRNILEVATQQSYAQALVDYGTPCQAPPRLTARVKSILVFSASNYCGRSRNNGGVAVVESAPFSPKGALLYHLWDSKKAKDFSPTARPSIAAAVAAAYF